MHMRGAPEIGAAFAPQVTAKQNKELSRAGYLCKYRPFTTGLFSGQWELRFFTLNGSALQYYKNEKATTAHPRGHVDVAVRRLSY